MPMPRSYTDDELAAAVKSSSTWAEVGRKLGKETRARYAREIANRLGLDTSHFVGQSWNKGRRTRPHVGEYLVNTGHFVGGLRDRLIEDGLKEAKCEKCGIIEWCEQPAPLEIDHIDGCNTNNLIENLRILCANCHSQTPTFRRAKSSLRGVQVDEDLVQ